ncbi:MAG: pqqD 1 [Candidatus Brocadiaceae bacterium]|nr:pqqD 1 [Candidatus Brocadiaceae bacterium]
MSTTRFIRKQGIVVQEMGSESLLYSVEDKVINVLNPTAKLIWELCDDTHTLEDMEREVRDHFSISNEYNLIEDIKKTLDVFVGKGIVSERTL